MPNKRDKHILGIKQLGIYIFNPYFTLVILNYAQTLKYKKKYVYIYKF